MARRLLLINESWRRANSPDLLSAMDRYTGVHFEVIKKALRENPKISRDLDILILTRKGDLYFSTDKVPYSAPASESYRTVKKIEVDTSKKSAVTTKLAGIVHDGNYAEVFVNLGAPYLELVRGFDNRVKARVEHNKGPGLGPKAGELKRWLNGDKRFYG